jgi:hypothetical protein
LASSAGGGNNVNHLRANYSSGLDRGLEYRARVKKASVEPENIPPLV